MIEFLLNNLLWREGLFLVVLLIGLGYLGWRWCRPLMWGSVAFFAFSLFFFRNPDRFVADSLYDDKIVVCPADGKIVDIVDDIDLSEGYGKKVSIFLSVFDVHVNWIPVSGVVEDVVYRPGAFTVAYLPKSSELNERNDVHIVRPDGSKILVRQIAGILARRIRSWINPGATVEAGQKFGMIRFGSRVELFLPKSTDLQVALGQRVYGGQTIIGRLS